MGGPVHNVLAVGAGPSNLSLAALASSIEDLDIRVLEQRDSFRWHPGLMVPGARLQVSPLKDLVSLVDPTNPHSFLNYLVETGRIYRFLVASRDSVSRREFEMYYSHVAQRLGSISFGERVEEVRVEGDLLRVASRRTVHRARNLVVGVGTRPRVPEFAEGLPRRDVFHVSEFQNLDRDTRGRRVLVVGGGQSAAEIVSHLISDDGRRPSTLTWALGRANALPLDDSPFSNEWFTPNSVAWFHGLRPPERRRVLGDAKLASDGISESLLLEIYRRLYELDYLSPGGEDARDGSRFAHSILPGARLTGLTRAGGRYLAALREGEGREAVHKADMVILATGFEQRLPDFLEPVAHLFARDEDGVPALNADYDIAWHQERGERPTGRIFVQNGGRSTHGISDPNLSLSAWRSALILNSLTGRKIFKIDGYESTLDLHASPGGTDPSEPRDVGASPSPNTDGRTTEKADRA